MRHKSLWGVASVSLIAMTTIATGAQAQQSQPPSLPMCSISATDTIPLGRPSAVVFAKFSSALGDSLTAAFPSESKIVVSSVKRSPQDSLTAELTLNTEQAIAGKWKLSLKGKRGHCTGELPAVRKPEPK